MNDTDQTTHTVTEGSWAAHGGALSDRCANCRILGRVTSRYGASDPITH